MSMEKSAIKKNLDKSLGPKFIYSEEYQDKYFLYKEIQQTIPELAESAIYEAIDLVNQIVKSPVKGKRFVEIFVEKLKI